MSINGNLDVQDMHSSRMRTAHPLTVVPLCSMMGGCMEVMSRGGGRCCTGVGGWRCTPAGRHVLSTGGEGGVAQVGGGGAGGPVCCPERDREVLSRGWWWSTPPSRSGAPPPTMWPVPYCIWCHTPPPPPVQ